MVRTAKSAPYLGNVGEEFFERKEPDFYDVTAREFAQWSLDQGTEPEVVLGALKANERASFAETLKERERKH